MKLKTLLLTEQTNQILISINITSFFRPLVSALRSLIAEWEVPGSTLDSAVRFSILEYLRTGCLCVLVFFVLVLPCAVFEALAPQFRTVSPIVSVLLYVIQNNVFHFRALVYKSLVSLKLNRKIRRSYYLKFNWIYKTSSCTLLWYHCCTFWCSY